MKHLGILLLLFTSFSVAAADYIYVVENSGNQYATELNLIQKITYPQDSLSIHMTDGAVQTYSLTAISQLVFKDIGEATLGEINLPVQNLSIYPNPFDAYLSIQLEAMQDGMAQVQVVDWQGRTLFLGQSDVRKGINRLDIDLEALKKGTYLLCVTLNNKTNNSIIIKK